MSPCSWRERSRSVRVFGLMPASEARSSTKRLVPPSRSRITSIVHLPSRMPTARATGHVWSRQSSLIASLLATPNGSLVDTSSLFDNRPGCPPTVLTSSSPPERMSSMRALRISLVVIGVFQLVLGALFLLVPGQAADLLGL